MEATRPRLTVDRSPVRCPFCREGIASEDSLAACGDCGARHHDACWDEGAGCASCRSQRALRDDPQRGAARAAPRAVPARDRRREELRQVFRLGLLFPPLIPVLAVALLFVALRRALRRALGGPRRRTERPPPARAHGRARG